MVPNFIAGGPEEDASPQTVQKGTSCQRDSDHEGKQASQYCQLYRQVSGSGVFMGMFLHTLQTKGLKPLWALAEDGALSYFSIHLLCMGGDRLGSPLIFSGVCSWKPLFKTLCYILLKQHPVSSLLCVVLGFFQVDHIFYVLTVSADKSS